MIRELKRMVEMFIGSAATDSGMKGSQGEIIQISDRGIGHLGSAATGLGIKSPQDEANGWIRMIYYIGARMVSDKSYGKYQVAWLQRELVGYRGSFLSRGSFRIASKFGASEMIGDRPCKREC